MTRQNLVGGLTNPEARSGRGTTPRRHRYGPDPSQFADLRVPARRRRIGTVVLIHGGLWGPRYGADNLDHLATLADIDTERVVAVGHSAGGHLATWAAGRPKLPSGAPGARQVVEIAGVLSLAGVLDLGAAARQLIGNGAAFELMGGGPADVPDRYAIADPLARVPISAAVRCVHARADDRVPFEESATYVTAASATGQDARLIEVDGDHFSVADPLAPTWPVVVTELEQLLGKA